MEFKERLKELRTKKSIKQKDLGQVLNYNYTTISNYESGRNEPSISDIKKLAEFFDVSIDYLLCINDYKRNYNDNNDHELLMKFQTIYYSSDTITKKLLNDIIQLLYYQMNKTAL